MKSMQHEKENRVPLYAVTLSARKNLETYLITGNIKHFPMKTFVVTPRQILDLLEKPI